MIFFGKFFYCTFYENLKNVIYDKNAIRIHRHITSKKSQELKILRAKIKNLHESTSECVQTK
jgi:hypothetical protein